MIILTDKYQLRIPWLYIWAWPKAARAARRHYPTGSIWILGIPVLSW